MQQPQPEKILLSDILITEELQSRTSRSANYKAENQALRALYRQMVQPETILQNVVDVALELGGAQTAGISLLETSKNLINHLVKNHLVENHLVENHLVEWASLPVSSLGQAGMPTPQEKFGHFLFGSPLETTLNGEENFRWNVIAGTLKQHVGAITPRNFSPCGICDSLGTPQLFSYPERYFTYLQAADTPIVEELVLPLIADNHVFGTIWIQLHDQTRHFDSEDVRIMTSLAEFTTTALLLNQRQSQELPAKNASALHSYNELSRALIENLPGGATFVVDHDLRYLLAEGEALSQAGFKPENFVGHTIFEVLPPELAANYEVVYRQALAGELFEFEHNTHGRSYISRGTPLREENGEVYAALAVSYDISDRKQAENALRESEEKYRTLFDSLDEGVTTVEVIFDENERAVDCIFLENNPAHSRQTGLPRDAIGKRFSEFVPDLERFWYETLERVVKTGEPERVEHSVAELDIWFDEYISRVGKEGSRTLVLVYNNITDRKRREANLAFLAEVGQDLAHLTNIDETMNALGEKIAAHFGLSACAFAELDEATEIGVINYGWHRSDVPSLIGTYRMEEFVTPEVLKLCRAGKAVVIRDVFSDPMTDGEQYAALNVGSFVSIPLVRDGEWRFLLVVYHTEPYDWRDDEIEVTRELANRIWTRLERARAEVALRESERKLQSAIAVAQLSPYEWNPHTGSLKWDARLKAMWGLPADAEINYEIYNTGIYPQDREYVERQMAKAIDPNGDGIFAAEFRTVGIEDKIERWVSVRGQTFFDGQGRPVHYVGAAQDVTDRKQALSDRIQLIQEQTAREEERQRAEALAQLDRAKTMFFSNVSHEFRTPLTLLLAPLFDALSDCTNPLAPTQRERLEIAHRNAIRLLKLVNTLLDFSRIEAGRMEAVYEPTDLATFTIELAGVFRSAIEQAGLKLVVDCPPLLPVYIDREMWEKIVLNLLSNAFKFTLEGEIIVRLYQYNDDYVTLQVQDTGAGIQADELPHIFERFYHVRTTQARTFEGSGIGLALVQELIKMHGGTVEVSSVVGEGSCFTVKIPSGTAHLPTNHIKASPCRDVIYHVSASAEIEERKHSLTHIDVINQDAINRVSTFILLVDDNADMRDYLKRILSEHVEVEAVADGAAAMAIISERVPDLVLSDVMMPHLDGFGLLKALRTDPRTKEVPIILLSARAGEESVIEGLQAGADDYLIKPFSATELVTRVLAHLQLAQLRAEALHREKTSNRMKDKLLAEVSHELQAPLVSILGWTRLLRSSPSNQSMLVKALETIERNATLQAKLIQDLLDISRITSGKISLNKAPVDLQSVIEAALVTVHQAQKAKNICLECVFNPKSITVEGDADRLQQIVLNLLTNAIKFTPEGGRIEVRLDVVENQAQIEVRDTGIGIEPEFLPYVFETFRQAKNSKTGLGLGLAIALQLVQLHGGALTAESPGTGEGATFTIKLPLSAR